MRSFLDAYSLSHRNYPAGVAAGAAASNASYSSSVDGGTSVPATIWAWYSATTAMTSGATRPFGILETDTFLGNPEEIQTAFKCPFHLLFAGTI